MTTLTIRDAQPADTDAMTVMILRSKASNGYDEAFMAACRAELSVTQDKLRSGRYRVALLDGAIIGCAALTTGPDHTGEVHAFFVDPNRQGTGAGRALWDDLVSEARALGLRRLTLDADPAAVPFYARMGCHKVGEAPSGSIPGRLLPVMEMAL